MASLFSLSRVCPLSILSSWLDIDYRLLQPDVILIVSLIAHMLQIGFLVFVENPHIDRTCRLKYVCVLSA